LKTLTIERALNAGARLRRNYYAHRLESCDAPLAVCAHVQQAIGEFPTEREAVAEPCSEAVDTYLHAVNRQHLKNRSVT